jgi:hypothetical protein
MARASIHIPAQTRDRLKKFKQKGQSYRDVLESPMDRVEYEGFMEEQYRRLQERSKFVPLRTE